MKSADNVRTENYNFYLKLNTCRDLYTNVTKFKKIHKNAMTSTR